MSQAQSRHVTAFSVLGEATGVGIFKLDLTSMVEDVTGRPAKMSYGTFEEALDVRVIAGCGRVCVFHVRSYFIPHDWLVKCLSMLILGYGHGVMGDHISVFA